MSLCHPLAGYPRHRPSLDIHWLQLTLAPAWGQRREAPRQQSPQVSAFPAWKLRPEPLAQNGGISRGADQPWLLLGLPNSFRFLSSLLRYLGWI